MKVVLDTNVLLISLPKFSPHHKIIQAFNNRQYHLLITTPIFLEYEEILTQKVNSFIADTVLGAFLEVPKCNVITVIDYYYWELINSDIDDNKFTDAFPNGQADYLVTNDANFNVVRGNVFPKIDFATSYLNMG